MPAAPFSWATAADHCHAAWLRGRFLARGSLSLAGGRTHLEFVVEPAAAPELAARLTEFGLPVSWRIRRGRGVVTSKNGEAVGTFLRRIGASGALLEVEARQVSRALRGELNRVLNAESANLQRAVSAAGRQLDAIATLEADGRLAKQPYVVRLVADARRETPEASLAELAERLEIHRSAVQRALERLERLATLESEPAAPAASPLWHDSLMRDVIVAGNWKMHTTPADAGDLAATIAARTRVAGVIRVICPPFVCLAAVRDALAEIDPDVAIGAQNVHHELQGAYTGEVSAPMLAGLATWVIVGHSERRRDAGETDALIGRKLGRAIDAGLRPILCVGEQLAEREAGDQDDVVRRQLAGALGEHDAARLTGRRPGHRLRAGLGDRHGAQRERPRRRRDGRRDPGRPGAARPGRRPRSRPDPVRRAASPPPTSTSSWPSPRSTARSSAAPRSRPTRWPASSPGPG